MAQTGLNVTRLKNKIKGALLFEQTEEEDWNASLERISQKIAQAVVEEVQEVIVTVPSGIPVSTTGTASAQTGATTQTKIATIA